jgi:urea transporter
MIRILAGAACMLGAIGLQLAMVVRVIEPSVVLGLVGYAALFAGMLLALLGFLARGRTR